MFMLKLMLSGSLVVFVMLRCGYRLVQKAYGNLIEWVKLCLSMVLSNNKLAMFCKHKAFCVGHFGRNACCLVDFCWEYFCQSRFMKATTAPFNDVTSRLKQIRYKHAVQNVVTTCRLMNDICSTRSWSDSWFRSPASTMSWGKSRLNFRQRILQHCWRL